MVTNFHGIQEPTAAAIAGGRKEGVKVHLLDVNFGQGVWFWRCGLGEIHILCMHLQNNI